MSCWLVHLNRGLKRARHAAVGVGHKVYSMAGGNMGQIDVHVFNTLSLCWMKLTPVTTGREHPLEVPSMLWGHTAVFIEYIIYIWGRSESSNMLYGFDVDTHRWFKPKVSGAVPGERFGHSACVLGKVMYIFGGFNRQTRYSPKDICKLDTTTMVWSAIIPRGTPASQYHSATIIGTKMFVFGGYSLNIGQKIWEFYNDFRAFDTETNCWLSTPSPQLLPEGRCRHSAFAYNGELYIFGGTNWHRNFTDLWKFNTETLSWKKVEPKGEGPCSRIHSMCCCMVGDRIILFGGSTDPLKFSEVSDLYVLEVSPSLKTLCKLAVIQYGLEQSELPHNIRWELAAMTTNSNRSQHNNREQILSERTRRI